MWVIASAARRHKLLLVWARGWNGSVQPSSAADSQVASHHVTASLLHPEDSRFKLAVRRQLGHSEPRERSAQSQVWRNEIPRQRKGDRVSSEIRKLSLEDSPDERERLGRQRSKPDSEAESHEILFGVAPCLLALTQGRRKAYKLFVKDGQAHQRASVLKLCEEATRQGVQVQRVSKKMLDKLSSGGVHQGVCLEASPLRFLTERSGSAPRRKDTPLWLVLEGIQDPMNLGAILRSAYFLGVDRVASSLHSSCPLSPVVSKASSGAMEVLGVYGYENLEEMVKLKVAQGWQVVGTVATEADESQLPVQCSHFQMTRPTVLLIGGEGGGLSRELLSLCQTLVTIPAGRDLFPGIESLNVSVATGILVHTLLSSRTRTT